MTIISHKHRFIFLCQRKTASTSIGIALNEVLDDDDIFLMSRNQSIEYDANLDEDMFSAVKRYSSAQRIFNQLSTREQSVAPHLPIKTVIEIVGEDVWNAYFKFAVVRNPWDWFASMYFFVMYRSRVGNLWEEKHAEIRKQLTQLSAQPLNYRLMRRIGTSLKNIPAIKCAYYMYKLGYHHRALQMLIDSGAYQYVFDDAMGFYFHNNKPALNAYIRYEHLDEDFGSVCTRLHLPQLSLFKTKTKPRQDQPRGYAYLYNRGTRRKVEHECATVIRHFNYSF